METRVASLVLVLLAGCGGPAASFRPASTAVYASRDPATVHVYTLRPARPYTVLGYLRARQEGWGQAGGPALIATLRDEAARHGCDAVVLDHGYCVEEPDRYSIRAATAPLLVAYCVAMRGSP